MEHRIATALAAALNPELDTEEMAGAIDEATLALGEAGNVEVQSYEDAGVRSRDAGFVITVGATQFHVSVTHVRGPAIEAPSEDEDDDRDATAKCEAGGTVVLGGPGGWKVRTLRFESWSEVEPLEGFRRAWARWEGDDEGWYVLVREVEGRLLVADIDGGATSCDLLAGQHLPAVLRYAHGSAKAVRIPGATTCTVGVFIDGSQVGCVGVTYEPGDAFSVAASYNEEAPGEAPAPAPEPAPEPLRGVVRPGVHIEADAMGIECYLRENGRTPASLSVEVFLLAAEVERLRRLRDLGGRVEANTASGRVSLLLPAYGVEGPTRRDLCEEAAARLGYRLAVRL